MYPLPSCHLGIAKIKLILRTAAILCLGLFGLLTASTSIQTKSQSLPSQPAPPAQSVAFQINPAHTGSQSDSITPPLVKRWSRDLGGAISYPLIAEGKVFVQVANQNIYGTKLYALSEVNGDTVWGPVDIGGTYWSAGIAYEAGRIFALNGDGQLRAFDVASGAQLWATQFCFLFGIRSRFLAAYPPTLTPTQYVNKLYANTGVTPTSAELAKAIGEFGSATNTGNGPARGRALRDVAETASFRQQEKNRAFVLMQYFGYLRRNPNDAPDADYSGYDFWLTKLNQFDGNFVNAEMVKAFITSDEYRLRFGP